MVVCHSPRLIILAKKQQQQFQGFRGRGSSMDHTMWIALNNIQSVDMETQSSVHNNPPVRFLDLS